MNVLLDTNILLRVVEVGHAHHQQAVSALTHLGRSNASLKISSQNQYEFLAVATRPKTAGGLGMDVTMAVSRIQEMASKLDVLYDAAEVVKEHRRLVLAYGVKGKSVHDCRLVATMLVSGVDRILTINSADFRRYHEIVVLDPRTFDPSVDIV